MYSIQRICEEKLHLIHELAHQIYYPTYSAILSIQQIDFMLQNIYSLQKLKEALLAGQEFFVLQDANGQALGFIALQSKENDAQVLRIEKLYLLPAVQGKGCGSLLLHFAAEQAQHLDKTILELNVNRGNNAYHFYTKQGFKTVSEIDIPYFGFILDDYVMQKQLSANSSLL